MFRALALHLTLVQRVALFAAAVARIALNALDLLGLVIVGAVASLMSGTVIAESSPLRSLIYFLNSIGFRDAHIGLAALAVAFFIVKALASITLNNIIGHLLCSIEVSVAASLFSKITDGGIERIEKLPAEKLAFSLTSSVNSATSQYLNAGSQLIGESFLLIGISMYLIFVNAPLFLTLAAFFGLVGFLMAKLVGRKASLVSRASHESLLVAQSTLLDLKSNYRQIVSMGQLKNFARIFSDARLIMGVQHGKMSSIANLPRYITEIAVMLGACILVAYRYFYEDAALSGPTIAIFFAGIFRVVAAMVPLQGALTQIKKSREEGQLCLEILKLKSPGFSSVPAQLINLQREGDNAEKPALILEGVSYIHPGQQRPTLGDVSMSVAFGEFLAITGKSGSGKSTLADLVIGVRRPTTGVITFGGVPVTNNPQGVGYVPQAVHLIAGTVRQNMLLHADLPAEYDDAIWSALQQVDLANMFRNLPEGLDTPLGPGGMALSGGEAQRLSLARVLLQKPKLVVLDEATSALDEKTDEIIQSTIRRLVGNCTLIVIAHKKSNLFGADRILNIEQGRIQSLTREISSD